MGFCFFFFFLVSPELGKILTFVLGIELWNSLLESELFSFTTWAFFKATLLA
jgi:hypothetical protein